MGDLATGAPVRAYGGNERFPLLDGVRALATISVVAFHVPFATGALGDTGWRAWLAYLTFGPPLFFILSGFLLYRPFLTGRETSATTFLRKRAMRIFPAYWVLLTVFWIWPGLPIAGGDVWKYYGLAHVYDGATVLGGLGVSWTLCTELAFYLVLPGAAWLLMRTKRAAVLKYSLKKRTCGKRWKSSLQRSKASAEGKLSTPLCPRR